jgi:hypothetical protein
VENKELIPGACPDDELLAGLIENRIDEITRAELECHVATCPMCSDVVAAVVAAVCDPPPPTIERPPAAVSANPAPRPVRRRALALAAGLALTTTVVLGYAGGAWLLDRGARELSRRATALIGQPVVIGRMAVRIGSDLRALTLQLADVHVGVGGATFSSAAGMEIAVAIAPLWRGAMTVERVRLIRPVMSISEQPPPAATPEQEHTRSRLGLDARNALSALLAAPRLEIAGGTLIVGSANGPPLTITRVGVTSTLAAGASRILLTGALAGGSITANAVVTADTPGTLALDADAHNLALAALPYARAWLSGIADCQLSATGSTETPRLVGRVRVRAGQVLAWNPFPTLLERAGAAALAGLAPPLAGGPLPFDELDLTLTAHRGDWRIRHARIASANGTASGDFRVTANRAVSGAGDIYVPPDLAAPLLTAVPRLASRRNADGGITLPYSIGGTVDAPEFAPRF